MKHLIVYQTVLIFLLLNPFLFTSTANTQDCPTTCYDPKPSFKAGDTYKWTYEDRNIEPIGSTSRFMIYSLEILQPLDGHTEEFLISFKQDYIHVYQEVPESEESEIDMYKDLPIKLIFPNTYRTPEGEVMNYFTYIADTLGYDEGLSIFGPTEIQYILETAISNNIYTEYAKRNQTFYTDINRTSVSHTTNVTSITKININNGLLIEYDLISLDSNGDIVQNFVIQHKEEQLYIEFGISSMQITMLLLLVVLITVVISIYYWKSKDKSTY